MTIALATAWNPRGEFSRFIELLPQFQEKYIGIAISLPPRVDPQLLLRLIEIPYVKVFETRDWSHGRFEALQLATEFDETHIQYADFDRILRWVETHPEEWRRILIRVEKCDCLIIGRTAASYQTHPKALLETEKISNSVVSYLVGRSMDVSAGSKSFSRLACESILLNSKPGNALGTDAEWPLILKQLGFQVDYTEVDGLDWESADRYQEKAADPDRQKSAATFYDSDPDNWSRRVAVAMEIIEVGFNTLRRDLVRISGEDP
jgi:hypothetical protein